MKKKNRDSSFVRKYFVIFISLFFFHTLFGQYNQLLHKSYAENRSNILELYKSLIALDNTAKVIHETKQIKKIAQANNDKVLDLEMDLFSVYYDITYRNYSSSDCIYRLDKIIKCSNNYDLKPIKIRAIRVLADFYWSKIVNYELAFEQYILLGKEIELISSKDYPEKPRDLIKIGQAYYFFKNYEQAELYLSRMFSIPQDSANAMFMNAARNTLGLCYQKQGLFDKSDYYFNQILKTPFQDVFKEWEHIAKGNLGANLYLKHEYDRAIPLLEFDYQQSKYLADYGTAAGASILLSDIFLQKRLQEKSQFYLSEARMFITLSKQNERLSVWFPIMSKWQIAFGSRGLAKNYFDSTIVAFNQEQKELNAIQLLKAQQKIDKRDKSLRETFFKLKSQKIINQIYLLIFLIIMLIIVFVFRVLVNKRKKQQIIIEKLKLENDLNEAKSKIRLFITKIDEQNTINERLENQFKNIQFIKDEDEVAFKKSISELKETKILTDDDWISFKVNFEKVYPDFVFNLKDKFPAITEAESRYLMLSTLHLTHKEMALALGVSNAAIRVTWSRVRKKLNGSSEDTAESLINRINSIN